MNERKTSLSEFYKLSQRVVVRKKKRKRKRCGRRRKRREIKSHHQVLAET